MLERIELGPRQRQVLLLIMKLEGTISVRSLVDQGIPDEVARKILYIFNDRGILRRKSRGKYELNLLLK